MSDVINEDISKQNSLGNITARLVDASELSIEKNLIKILNENIKPPLELTLDDVHIRAMYIVSDEVNSFGGRFPVDEHQHLAELLIDSPVMVGHRKDKLPVARNFYSKAEKVDDRCWVKSYFYWLKDSEGAGNLKNNIDGGIYKECSIGFTFSLPECSICGRDIRTCHHEPFASYNISGVKTTCHFNYRQIEKVLETSLVYRGAVPDTSISRSLNGSPDSNNDRGKKEFDTFTEIKSLLELNPLKRYLVVPCYDGLTVTINCNQGKTEIYNDDSLMNYPVLDAFKKLNDLKLDKMFGLLVGYRGKERCSRSNLVNYLEKGAGPVSRLELKLLVEEQVLASFAVKQKGVSVTILPHRISHLSNIAEHCRKLKTKDGVMIHDSGSFDSSGRIYKYNPLVTEESRMDCYWLFKDTGNDSCSLVYTHEESLSAVKLRQFHLNRLEHGGRFIADAIENGELANLAKSNITLKGTIDQVRAFKDGRIFKLNGDMSGLYAFRPFKLNGRKRLLFYALEARSLDLN